MPKKILIADDEPQILKVLSKRLSSAGYKVLTASNGQECFEAATKEGPDLIILDILMPEMDGTETAVKLKESPLTKHIPVMFLTALRTRPDEEAKGTMVGSNLIFAKPYDTRELMGKISEALDS